VCFFYFVEGRIPSYQGEGKNYAPRCSITPKFIPIAREEQGMLLSSALAARKKNKKKEARRSPIRPPHKPRGHQVRYCLLGEFLLSPYNPNPRNHPKKPHTW
jgi:hypothetical protein